MQLKLSNLADLDLELLTYEGTLNYGTERSNSYVKVIFSTLDLITRFPKIGYAVEPERFTELRRINSGSHMIFYYPHDSYIWVSRIAHLRMDFANFDFTDSPNE